MNPWPTGDACPECGYSMEVGAVGTPFERITWQQCGGCRIGWGPVSGFVDLEDDEPVLMTDVGHHVDEEFVTDCDRLRQKCGGERR